MKELTRVETSVLIGGSMSEARCNRIGRRITRRYGEGKDISRLASKYVDGGCLEY